MHRRTLTLYIAGNGAAEPAGDTFALDQAQFERKHDPLTLEDAIERHGGEAQGVIGRYDALTAGQKPQLVAFLKSL